MADTKVSALTALLGLSADTSDEFYVNDGGTSKKITLGELRTAIAEPKNASTAAQGPGFASDTYLTGSYVTIPPSRLKAGSIYRVKFHASKTAAGTATPIIQVRTGTAGTTADTSRCSLTFTAQTAAIDNAIIELFCTFRSVGSSTSAVLFSAGMVDHTLTATGFSVSNTSIVGVASSGFDSTTANLGIGVSVNGGTSAAWTVQMVQAELQNLAF